jgi:hypothetical protein
VSKNRLLENTLDKLRKRSATDADLQMLKGAGFLGLLADASRFAKVRFSMVEKLIAGPAKSILVDYPESQVRLAAGCYDFAGPAATETLLLQSINVTNPATVTPL